MPDADGTHGVKGVNGAPRARNPVRRERNVILAGLVVVTGLAWALVLWQGLARADEMGMERMAPMGMTMGLAAPVFLAAWVAMMAAMMFPPAAPMLLTFASIHAQRRARGLSVAPTAVFSTGYLLVWVAFGGAAYVAATWLDALASQLAWLTGNAERVVGALLVLAGLYQLSPLKRACLRQCQSPLAFFATSWRDGYAGALRMGIKHGGFCLGCCWLLFVLPFPIGVMNVPVMLALTLLIAAEKLLPIGQRVAQATGGLLLGAGALFLIVSPRVLPRML